MSGIKIYLRPLKYSAFNSITSSVYLLLMFVRKYRFTSSGGYCSYTIVASFAATWAVSVYFAYARTWKPFNPILGETYEMVDKNGLTFLAEQVSSKAVRKLANKEH